MTGGTSRALTAPFPLTAGFTLLELVLVLSVIGIALAVVPLATGRTVERESFKADVQAVYARLRLARTMAIHRANRVRVVFEQDAVTDLWSLTIQVEKDPLTRYDEWESAEAALGKPLRLDGAVQLTLQGDHPDRIEFRPDGTADAATVEIGHRTLPDAFALTVDGATGIVKFDEEEE